MADVVATSQPPACLARTGTLGQSRFCTTAVGTSTKVLEAEYSIRTREGVRNSNRAFSTITVESISVVPHEVRSIEKTARIRHLPVLERMRGGCIRPFSAARV